MAKRDSKALKLEVDRKRREISSDNLSMSVGELLNLYRDGELDIHPEYQRVFRWTAHQKSRLIESVLLGIPLPPVYVATNDSGVWEVVDGVQRLSTIFEFMGELMAPESDDSDELKKRPALVLEATKHLPQLRDAAFESLDQTLRLEIKRARIDVKILAREQSSGAHAKFDLFERLNTYGTALSPQELRNCILVSLNPDFYRWLKKIAENEAFRSTTLLSESQLLERYDMDLSLRFFALRDVRPAEIGDVHEFLRDRMELIATDASFKLSSEEKLFSEVFEFLDEHLGGDAFRPWNSSRKSFRGAFSLAAFEGIGLGLGLHWPQIRKVRSAFDVGRVVKAVWATPEYKKSFSGLRARERMARVIPAANDVILKELKRVGSTRS